MYEVKKRTTHVEVAREAGGTRSVVCVDEAVTLPIPKPSVLIRVFFMVVYYWPVGTQRVLRGK